MTDWQPGDEIEWTVRGERKRARVVSDGVCHYDSLGRLLEEEEVSG